MSKPTASDRRKAEDEPDVSPEGFDITPHAACATRILNAHREHLHGPLAGVDVLILLVSSYIDCECTAMRLDWKIIESADVKLCRGDRILREVIDNFSHFRAKRYEPQVAIARACVEAAIPRMFGDTFEENKERIQTMYGVTDFRPEVLVTLNRRLGASWAVSMTEVSLMYSMGDEVVLQSGRGSLPLIRHFMAQLPCPSNINANGTSVVYARKVNGIDTIMGKFTLGPVVSRRGFICNASARTYIEHADYVSNGTLRELLLAKQVVGWRGLLPADRSDGRHAPLFLICSSERVVGGSNVFNEMWNSKRLSDGQHVYRCIDANAIRSNGPPPWYTAQFINDNARRAGIDPTAMAAHVNAIMREAGCAGADTTMLTDGLTNVASSGREYLYAFPSSSLQHNSN